MSSNVARNDVAYVGGLNDMLTTVSATVRDSNGWSTGPTYTLVYVQTARATWNNYIALSRGYMGSEFTGDGYNIAHIEFIRPIYWESSTSRFRIYYGIESTGYQYLHVNNDGVVIDDNDEGSTIILSTQDPAGYESDTLLAGVRYTLSTTDREAGEIRIHYSQYEAIDDSSDEEYYGLYNVDAGGSSDDDYLTMTDVLWSFIPVDTYPVNTRTFNTSETLSTTQVISQCVYMQGINGFGTSSICSNWADYAGFTAEEYYQPLRYYYSSQGICGDSYPFTDFLGQDIIVSSSIGNCQSNNGDCNYNDSIIGFICDGDIDPNPQPEPQPNPNPQPEPQPNPNPQPEPDSNNRGILSEWWFWGLLILLITVAFVIIIVVLLTMKKKTPSN